MNLDDLRALLLKAARLADALSHAPSIVNMEAVSEHIDNAFLALDNVRGVTLEDLDEWAQEARTDRRIDEAREAA